MANASLEDALWSFTRELTSRQRAWNLTPSLVKLYGELESWSLSRQYGLNDHDKEPRLRMSALSKPLLYQLMPMWGFGKLPEESPKMDTLETFHFGDSFENRVFVLMGAYFGATKVIKTKAGLTTLTNDDKSIVITRDKEVELHGVSGHIDIHIRYYDEEGIVEVKTVASHYAERFHKFLPDDRGYVSQLASYLQATGLQSGYFIVKDKSTHEVHLVPLERDWVEDVHLRNISIIPLLHKYSKLTIRDFFDMPLEDRLTVERYDGSLIPEADLAYVKRGTVEFMVVPESMKYAPNLNCIYELGEQEGSKRTAVKRVRSADEIIKCLEGNL